MHRLNKNLEKTAAEPSFNLENSQWWFYFNKRKSQLERDVGKGIVDIFILGEYIKIINLLQEMLNADKKAASTIANGAFLFVLANMRGYTEVHDVLRHFGIQKDCLTRYLPQILQDFPEENRSAIEKKLNTLSNKKERQFYVDTLFKLGYILKKFTSPNSFVTDGNELSAYRNTLLERSARSGFIEIVDILLKQPEINVEEGNNYTPLMAASVHGHLDIMKLLLAHGAQPDTKKKGETALSLAQKHRQQDSVNFLKGKMKDEKQQDISLTKEVCSSSLLPKISVFATTPSSSPLSDAATSPFVKVEDDTEEDVIEEETTLERIRGTIYRFCSMI